MVSVLCFIQIFVQLNEVNWICKRISLNFFLLPAFSLEKLFLKCFLGGFGFALFCYLLEWFNLSDIQS